MDIEKRMRGYESVTNTYLVNRMPVIIRVDGRSFHTFTKGFHKPFDQAMIFSMEETMKALCENIQGCVLGYTESDEITLVVIDYDTLETQPFFSNRVQKICSVVASMATLYFNRAFNEFVIGLENTKDDDYGYLEKVYRKAMDSGATFDCRCFNLPKEEVTNCLFWRQMDCMRNSINSLARVYYSNKELYKLSAMEVKEKLKLEKGIDWDKYPTVFKRGSCCIKCESEYGSEWIIDLDIPVFKGDGRRYVDKRILINNTR